MSESSQTKMGRRDVLRIGAGVGAAGAVGSAGMSGTVAALPEPLDPRSAPRLAAQGVRYLYDDAVDLITGDDFDEEAYEEAEQEETHAGIRESGLDMMATNDSVITGIQNVLENSREIAYSDARYEMIEALNLGNSESEVRSRGESEVGDFFTVQQINLLKHFSQQLGRMGRMYDSADAAGISTGGSEDGLTMLHNDGEEISSNQYSGTMTMSHDLVDGESYSYTALEAGGNDRGIDRDLIIRLYPFDEGSSDIVMDYRPFKDVMNRIEDLHSEVIDEVNEFVDGIYEDYEQGDIDLSDIVRGSDIVRMSSDEEENPVAGADLAMMGLSANTDSQMTIELLDEGRTVDGSVYMQNAPDGGLEVGRTYSAGDFDGTVFIAYQTSEGSETSEIQGDFAVMDAIDSEGESLDSVEYSEQTGQQTSNFDPDELNDELQRLNDLQIQLQEQQQRIAEDGGGGGLDLGFDAGIGNTGLLVGAAAVVLALIGSSS